MRVFKAGCHFLFIFNLFCIFMRNGINKYEEALCFSFFVIMEVNLITTRFKKSHRQFLKFKFKYKIGNILKNS